MDTTVAASPDSEASEQTADSAAHDTSGELHPLDALPEEPSRDDAPSGRVSRGLGSSRHTTSVVLALLAVPAGYGFLDYGFYRAVNQAQSTASGRLPNQVLIALGAAAGCFLLAGLTGRISALGPLLAGLVWGAGPSAWVALDHASFVSRLNDLPEMWTHTGFGLNWAGYAAFPVVTGLLLGCAVAGRWRRAKPVARW